jgi:hypothetical protein
MLKFKVCSWRERLTAIGCYWKMWGQWKKLTMQLNQKGDCLLLIIEGVTAAVHHWGEVCHFNVLAIASGVLRKRVHYFSLYGTWTDSNSTRGCADIPFLLLKFSACSSRSKSLATSYLMLLIFVRQWPSYWTPFFIFQLFSIQYSRDLKWGNQLFIPIHVWQMYKHVIYMMNSPFEGWHMVITLVWWNKNRDFCPNSTMKTFWVAAIGSPTSLEYKML